MQDKKSKSPLPDYMTISEKNLQHFMQERMQLIWFISMKLRPGRNLFSTYLEYTLYPPNTEKNDSLELLDISFGGARWMVLGFPMRDLVFAKLIAKFCGLRIVTGIPAVMARHKVHYFPMKGRRCRTLLNVTGYSFQGLSPDEQRIRLDEEEALAKALHEGWNPTPQELHKAYLDATGIRPTVA